MQYISIHTVNIYIYMCVYIYMYVCMYACMHACMHAWMDGWMYVCMYVCVCGSDLSDIISSPAEEVLGRIGCERTEESGPLLR